METIKKALNSTPFKLAVAVLSAAFTAVRFGGLAFPQYAQTAAVFGLVVCVIFFLALGYYELISKLVVIGSDRTELIDRFKGVEEGLEKLNSEIEQSKNSAISPLADDTLYESLAQKYGYANEIVDIECLLYLDGSARVERRVTVRAFAKYDEIDTYLIVPEMIDEQGEKVPRILDADSLNPNRTVSKERVEEKLGRATAVLSFYPALVAGVTTTYRLVERTPSDTFILEATAKELEEREKSKDPDEYFGWNINRPTKSLNIKVIFPEGYIPKDPKSQVRFATASGLPSIQLQTEEQNRIMIPKLERGRGGSYVLGFEVQYPMTNLIYMLRWLPQLKQ